MSYLCDTSIWVAISVQAHQHNLLATAWFDTIDETEKAFFCRATQISFLRLLTTASVMAQYGLTPLTNDRARDALERLLEDARVGQLLDEPPGLDRYWREFSARRTSSPNIWMDTYLAAFARAADYQLVTIDGGFRQYPGLDAVVLIEGASQ